MFKDFFINRRVWRNGLIVPIYVPAELQNVRILLSERELQAAAAALWKLSSLGSDSAAALLEYLCLRDGICAVRIGRQSLNDAVKPPTVAMVLLNSFWRGLNMRREITSNSITG